MKHEKNISILDRLIDGAIRVCVLCGGDSHERDISLLSGQRVFHSLQCHNVLSEHLLPCLNLMAGIKIHADLCVWDGKVSSLVHKLQSEPYTCVFNALHGGSGENGYVQSVLNMMHMPYTGSGAVASMLGMHKNVQYDILKQFGIRIPKYDVRTPSELHDVPMPFVIKPISDGSSFGVALIRSKKELGSYMAQFFDVLASDALIEQRLMVSEYISGRELTVAVLDSVFAAVKALEVTDIIFDAEIFSYEQKYTDKSVSHCLPAHLSASVREEAMRISEIAHVSLGCRGLTRCDYRFDGENLYFLELNTLPGMTSVSLAPEQAAFCGIGYENLVQQLVVSARYDS